MKKGTGRTQRVADLIQTELATILQRESLSDKLGLVTITEVSISPDLSFAKVYISTLIDENAKEAVDLLNSESKNLRFLLAKRVLLRIIPELKFIYDDSTARGTHISSLIDKVLQDKKK